MRNLAIDDEIDNRARAVGSRPGRPHSNHLTGSCLLPHTVSGAPVRAVEPPGCTDGGLGFQCIVGHGVEREAAEAAAACEECMAEATVEDVDRARRTTMGYGPGFQAQGQLESETYGN